MSTLGFCIIIFYSLGHFPVLLCTTKLAQTTSQYYIVLQSLHKALPSTTLYYKACTKHFPVLLCTTKLAQTTSQHYFVLQSLHKARSSTTLCYKACTKSFPALICTTKSTKLAQRISQDFVLQSLHKVLPSTTLYYKACTKSFPALICTTKLAQRISQYYFVLQSLYYFRPDDDATPTRRRRDEPLEANKGPAPRPPDYKREPFATHSRKNRITGMNIQNHQITSSTPSYL